MSGSQNELIYFDLALKHLFFWRAKFNQGTVVGGKIRSCSYN